MFEPWLLALLFLTGLFAGFVDAIAGGGGLITLPVMLSCGFDPQTALGTNKLQASFGSGSASWHYTRAGVVRLPDCVRGFVITFLAAIAGSWAVQRLDPALLRRVIPILLVLIALYVLLKPSLGAADCPPRMSRTRFDLFFGCLLGFYDGFLGPGTGTFWTTAFVLCLGFNLTRATGYTKIMNFASNLSALGLFLLRKKVLFIPGLAMGAGQLVGARLGASMVVRRGARFIRPIFITVVLAITLKLIYDV